VAAAGPSFRSCLATTGPLRRALNGSAFSIHRRAEPVHKSVQVVGAAASGSVPGSISGSFVPGAIVG